MKARRRDASPEREASVVAMETRQPAQGSAGRMTGEMLTDQREVVIADGVIGGGAAYRTLDRERRTQPEIAAQRRDIGLARAPELMQCPRDADITGLAAQPGEDLTVGVVDKSYAMFHGSPRYWLSIQCCKYIQYFGRAQSKQTGPDSAGRTACPGPATGCPKDAESRAGRRGSPLAARRRGCHFGAQLISFAS
ncbi:hypothetical protein BGLA2_1120009 [Burkholderia gladioli]|nr:hypothetical protein BGLA2_1120009 [Burkholderia gladioli]